VKEDKIGRTRSTHGRIEKCIQILVGIYEGRYQSQDVSVDGKTILE